MSKFEGVLIATDLDGTLLKSDHTGISEENLKAIDYFRKNGGNFTVATGRPPVTAEKILETLKLDVPAILINGAMIFDRNAKKIIKSHNLSQEAIDYTKDIIEKFDEVGVEIFTAEELFMVHASTISIEHFRVVGKEYVLSKFSDLPPPEEWFKINFTHHNAEYLANVENYFIENHGEKYQHCYSCKTFFETTNLYARKDYGVFDVAQMLDIEKEHIYTIGDNFNDYYMIKNAKYGFATANGEEEIKNIAHKVLGTCDENALAQMIEYLDSIY